MSVCYSLALNKILTSEIVERLFPDQQTQNKTI